MANLVNDARRRAIASVSQGSLNQLTLALHNYHEAFGCFPPAYVADAAGRPIHSWRVLVLPYIDEGRLYGEYDFSEPWDGPRNSRLLKRMPEMFHSHSERPSDCFTNIVAVTGPGTAFPGAVRWRRPMVTFADSITAYSLSPDISPDALDALATIGGGESDTRPTLLEAGFLRRGSWLVD